LQLELCLLLEKLELVKEDEGELQEELQDAEHFDKELEELLHGLELKLELKELLEQQGLSLDEDGQLTEVLLD